MNDTIWEEMVFYKSPFTKSVVSMVEQQSKYAIVRFRWQLTAILPSEKVYKNEFWYLDGSFVRRCTVETKMVICGINKKICIRDINIKKHRYSYTKWKRIEMRIWDTNAEKSQIYTKVKQTENLGTGCCLSI